jgi:hypothetical protein
VYATNHLDTTATIWQQQGTNSIGKIVVPMLDVRLADGLVVAGTHANGIFSANITDTLDMFTSVFENERALKNSVIVFPNPANEKLAIGNGQMAIRNIEIYNVNGRLVFSQQPAARNQKLLEINVSELTPGIYFAVIKNDRGEKAVARFVIAR